MKLFLSVVLSFLFLQGLCQPAVKDAPVQAYYPEDPVLHIAMKKTDDPQQHFEARFLYSICNIHFYKDSSFVFYYVDAVRYEMAVGNYTYSKGIYILNSDSIKTAAAGNNPEFYKTYFKFRPPSAFRIEKAGYSLKNNVLSPVYNSGGNKIELASTSQALLSQKLAMVPFRSVHYQPNSNDLRIDFTGNTYRVFRPDSLWGFTILEKGTLKTYRVTPRGFNWYGMPGIQVVQLEPFVIYTVGEGRLYSYFSRSLNSKIYPLKLEEVKREFGEHQAFIAALTKEFGANKTLSAKGSSPESYRILEIYKETSGKAQE